MENAPSSTSLEVAYCFKCDFREMKYKVTCKQPGCKQYRGKIYVCGDSECWQSCPNCNWVLARDDIKTATGALTSLQTVEEEAESVMAPAGKGHKGKGAGKQAKGKGGGKNGKGRGKQGRAARSGKARGVKIPCLKLILC